MLEQFKHNHPWLRRTSWVAMGSGGILLLWLSGGFPPRAWRLLFEVMPQLTRLWTLRGSAILFPMTLLVMQSLAWAVAWGLLLWVCVAFIRSWRRRERERQLFEIDFQNAHDAVTQEQEVQPQQQAVTPPVYRVRPPLVLTGQTEYHTAPHLWQRQLCLHMTVGIEWDAGITRKDRPNEDSLIALQGTCIYNQRLLPFGLFVVADGMGGHAYGQDASYLAVQAILKTVLPDIAGSECVSDEMPIEILAEGIQQANQAVFQRSQEVGAEMGTTITVALVIDTMAFVVNVGDSRTYLYRECDGLKQVTYDHSQVARLVAAGKITQDEIYTHPERNKVYRALGEKTPLEIDWFTVPLQGNDCLLLCSDGLWEMVRNPQIETILKQAGCNPPQASKALIQAALKGGGLDNVSAIVVRIAPKTVL